MGRTCDDPHTMLIEQQFSASSVGFKFSNSQNFEELNGEIKSHKSFRDSVCIRNLF